MNESIAIIGMAGRFPKAENIDIFWDNVRRGRECISVFEENELEAGGVEFPRPDTRMIKARGYLEDADKFDAAFFGYSPREAEIMDPQHRIFLECASAALEDAGCDPEREKGLIGVFGSASANLYFINHLLSRADILDAFSAYQLVLASDKDFLPTRVAYKLNLRGPALNIQTACSSSLVSVCVACQNLLTYQCDIALAGAASVTFPQKQVHFYQGGGIASADGHCRAFDAKASGTVPGEGTAVVVLKRLSDALADGDAIYAVIKGFAMNNDGGRKAGYTAPSEAGQAEVIAWAQAMAGIDPGTIGYVEAHGTATPLGDPIEVRGLTRAFRERTERKNYCALGSVKTHIGHLDVAAGVAGLINATLALHHKVLPPSLNFEAPNPQIDFENSPFYVNTRAAEWKGDGGIPRRAAVTSLGIGSTNAHVVLEEAPPAAARPSDHPPQLLVLSAKTPGALDATARNLADYLLKNPDTNLADVAWTLQTGRQVFEHRRAVICRDVKEAADALRQPCGNLRGGARDADEPQLAAIAEGWLAGESVSWAEIHGNERRHRVHLPTYPFERKRHRVEPAAVMLAPRIVEQPAAPALESSRNGLEKPPGEDRAGGEGKEQGNAKSGVGAELRALFEKLSGFDLANADGHSTFLELGFDSLMLTQASQDIDKRFGERIPFGRLAATLSTFDSLTAHLEQALAKKMVPASARPDQGLQTAAANGRDVAVVANAK